MGDIFQDAAVAKAQLLKDLALPKSKDRPPRESPVLAFVRKLSAETGVPYFVTAEVADQIGISPQTVRKYRTKAEKGEDGVEPSFKARQGKMLIYLYTEDDVTALREFIDGRFSLNSND